MKNLDKRDLVTVLSLLLIFFFMASLNLGFIHVPKSDWKVSGNDEFYIDLDGENNVSEICFLLKNGKLNLDISTGQPGNWREKKSFSIQDYYKWIRIEINDSITHLKIGLVQSSGEICEMVLLDQGLRIPNLSLYRENSQNNTLLQLIDEQELVITPINYMSETIFDEIYFVRAAEDYLTGKEPYESTHPPLGKLIIATGISVFGFNPFGWRIMGVLFASAMIPVMYFLGKEFTGLWFGGTVSSILLIFDFMHFTISRMATIDTFLAFFLLTSQLFFYRYSLHVVKTGWSASLRPYFVSILMLALGFSTKWTAIFSLIAYVFYIGLLRSYLSSKKVDKNYTLKSKKVIYAVTGSIIIFGIVYFLSYVPYLQLGHSIQDVYYRQWSMLDYHTELTAIHPFSSPWWSWPLIIRPIWLYISEITNRWVSTIALMGNPALWWIGLVSIITLSEKALKEKNLSYLYIATIFFCQWVPYAFISRTLFLYHFYPNVIILCLSTSTQIIEIWKEDKTRWKIIIYFLLLVTLFGLFYPIISGVNIPVWWRDSLKWFPSWLF